MTKFIAILCLVIMSFFLTVAIMINGYGVEIKSWSWLVLGGIGNFILTMLTFAVSSDKNN